MPFLQQVAAHLASCIPYSSYQVSAWDNVLRLFPVGSLLPKMSSLYPCRKQTTPQHQLRRSQELMERLARAQAGQGISTLGSLESYQGPVNTGRQVTLSGQMAVLGRPLVASLHHCISVSPTHQPQARLPLSTQCLSPLRGMASTPRTHLGKLLRPIP